MTGGGCMIEVEVRGVSLRLETAAGVFSPRRADRGTLAMLSAVEFAPGMKVLDLGCGCGLVGVLAAPAARPPGRTDRRAHV